MSIAFFSKEQILQNFSSGMECPQQICLQLAELVNMNKQDALSVPAALGAGLIEGQTCGCIIAALILLGKKFGPRSEEDRISRDLLLEKRTEFLDRFHKKFRGNTCVEILKGDLRIPEEKKQIMDEARFAAVCAPAVQYTVEILTDMLK